MSEDSDSNVHVIPLNDLKEHELMANCWCSPIRDEEDAYVVVHNALDGRDRRPH